MTITSHGLTTKIVQRKIYKGDSEMSKFQEIREKSKNGEYKLLTNIKKYIKQFNKRERKKILIQLLITLVLS